MQPGGEQTNQLAEVLYLTTKMENAVIPDGLREKIDLKLKRLRRMARQGQSAGEYEPVAKYIDWCLSIPWGQYIQDNVDLNNAKAIIDSMHYGSEHVKDVVLEYLAVMRRKTQMNQQNYTAPVLAFVGVQGAGKTSLAKAIAQSLGRPFYRISLGALGTSTELRGSPSESVSGQPGQIVRAIVNTKCMNPVILLDEFDKVSGDDGSRKDFMAIMLEILDPQQNSTFRDWYIDYPVDLSKILFIATANRFRTITRELLDRLEFIEFPDYTLSEKVQIAKNFLFPKVLNYAGLQPQELQVGDDAWPILVEAFGKDQGVRRLEQNLQKMARTVIKGIMLGTIQSVLVTAQNAAEFTKNVLPSVEDVRHKDFTEANQGLGPTQNSQSTASLYPISTSSTTPIPVVQTPVVPVMPTQPMQPVLIQAAQTPVQMPTQSFTAPTPLPVKTTVTEISQQPFQPAQMPSQSQTPVLNESQVNNPPLHGSQVQLSERSVAVNPASLPNNPSTSQVAAQKLDLPAGTPAPQADTGAPKSLADIMSQGSFEDPA